MTQTVIYRNCFQGRVHLFLRKGHFFLYPIQNVCRFFRSFPFLLKIGIFFVSGIRKKVHFLQVHITPLPLPHLCLLKYVFFKHFISNRCSDIEQISATAFHLLLYLLYKRQQTWQLTRKFHFYIGTTLWNVYRKPTLRWLFVIFIYLYV